MHLLYFNRDEGEDSPTQMQARDLIEELITESSEMLHLSNVKVKVQGHHNNTMYLLYFNRDDGEESPTQMQARDLIEELITESSEMSRS